MAQPDFLKADSMRPIRFACLQMEEYQWQQAQSGFKPSALG